MLRMHQIIRYVSERIFRKKCINNHDNYKIRDEKLQCNINNIAAKISASGKIDKYEYLIGEEILPSNRRQIIEHAKFMYSILGKLWKNKQEQVYALNSLHFSNNENDQ